MAISGLSAPHGPMPPLISYQMTRTTPNGPAPSWSASTVWTTYSVLIGASSRRW